MITVINGTNRVGNISQLFSKLYVEGFQGKTSETIHYITMETIPSGIYSNLMFTSDGRSSELTEIQDQVIIPSEKIFFIIPEYNGGIPGILKLFIDACSTYNRDRCFKGKKIGMLGVATGRAGNLRGMEHMTGVMNYLGAVVMPNRLPVSKVNTLIESDKIVDQDTLDTIEAHIEEFISF